MIGIKAEVYGLVGFALSFGALLGMIIMSLMGLCVVLGYLVR